MDPTGPILSTLLGLHGAHSYRDMLREGGLSELPRGKDSLDTGVAPMAGVSPTGRAASPLTGAASALTGAASLGSASVAEPATEANRERELEDMFVMGEEWEDDEALLQFGQRPRRSQVELASYCLESRLLRHVGNVMRDLPYRIPLERVCTCLLSFVRARGRRIVRASAANKWAVVATYVESLDAGYACFPEEFAFYCKARMIRFRAAVTQYCQQLRRPPPAPPTLQAYCLALLERYQTYFKRIRSQQIARKEERKAERSKPPQLALNLGTERQTGGQVALEDRLALEDVPAFACGQGPQKWQPRRQDCEEREPATHDSERETPLALTDDSGHTTSTACSVGTCSVGGSRESSRASSLVSQGSSRAKRTAPPLRQLRVKKRTWNPRPLESSAYANLARDLSSPVASGLTPDPAPAPASISPASIDPAFIFHSIEDMFRSEDETSSSRRAEEPADLPDMTRSAMLDFEDMFQTAEPGEAEDSHCLLFKQESSDEYGEENFGPTNDASDPAPEGDQSPPLDRSRPRSGTSLPTELETDWVTMEADRGTRLAATSLATVSGDAVSGDVVSGDVVSGDVVSGDVVSGDVVFGDAFEDMFVDTVGEVQGGEVMQWDELAGFAAEDVDAAEEEAYILTAPELAEFAVWRQSVMDYADSLTALVEQTTVVTLYRAVLALVLCGKLRGVLIARYTHVCAMLGLRARTINQYMAKLKRTSRAAICAGKSPVSADGPGLAQLCEVDGGHGGWGSSPTDESKRLQVVREELLDEEGPGCGVLPAEVVTAEVAAEAAEECGRRRTQSVEITTANGETETLERRDAILRAVTEATSKVHLISLGAKLVSFMGLKNRLIRKSAFFPPSPESYRFVTLPPTATNALMKPPTSADKILAEECVLFLRTHGHKEGTTEAGSMLAALPACKLRVAAFRLRRVADGDMTTAALLLYKPIYKSEAVCDETRADMLTDLQLRPLLIFSHGNSIDIGYHLMSLVQLATRLHVNVLAYDYPEYGLSRGKLTEKNILKAFRVAYDFARQRLKVPRTMIFLYGQSVGSVPTCYGAGNPDQFNCCGVILHAPLASALRIVAPSTKKSISTSDVLDNNKRIGNCPWPILIIHGCHDDGVPPWHGCQLDRTARDISNASETSVSMFKEYVLPHVKTLAPSQGLVDMEMAWSNRVTLWLPEFANHNNIEILYKSEYFKRLRLFIAQYAGRFAFRKKGE